MGSLACCSTIPVSTTPPTAPAHPHTFQPPVSAHLSTFHHPPADPPTRTLSNPPLGPADPDTCPPPSPPTYPHTFHPRALASISSSRQPSSSFPARLLPRGSRLPTAGTVSHSPSRTVPSASATHARLPGLKPCTRLGPPLHQHEPHTVTPSLNPLSPPPPPPVQDHVSPQIKTQSQSRRPLGARYMGAQRGLLSSRSDQSPRGIDERGWTPKEGSGRAWVCASALSPVCWPQPQSSLRLASGATFLTNPSTMDPPGLLSSHDHELESPWVRLTTEPRGWGPVGAARFPSCPPAVSSLPTPEALN